MADNAFWKTAPAKKIGTPMTDWRPGEARSYIPVVNFGVQRQIPQAGAIGTTVSIDGDRHVSFVVKGNKTQGTTHRDPRDKSPSKK